MSAIRRRTGTARRAGFTLLEMIIVMLILASVMAGIVGVVHRTSVNLGNILSLVKQGREAPAILALFERDLGSAYIDARMDAFFELKRDGDAAELRFVTSRNSMLYVNGVQSELVEVGYKLQPAQDEEGSRELYTLLRREDFLLDDAPLDGGLWIPVANNIVEFQIICFKLPEGEDIQGDGLSTLRLGDSKDSEPLDEWTKDERFLPYAVKIVLGIDIREGEDRKNPATEPEGIQTFSSLVRLPPFPRNLEKKEDKAVLKLNPIPQAPGNNANNASNNSNSNNAPPPSE